MLATINDNFERIEPLNMPIIIKNISTNLLVDTGSVGNILNKSLAAQVFTSNLFAIWVSKNNKPQLRTFPNETIQIKG